MYNIGNQEKKNAVENYAKNFNFLSVRWNASSLVLLLFRGFKLSPHPQTSSHLLENANVGESYEEIRYGNAKVLEAHSVYHIDC